MANKRKKIAFYKLSLEKHVDKNTKTQDVALNIQEIEDYFQIIYEQKMQVLPDGNRVIGVDVSNNQYVFEIMEYINHRAFIKIGQQNSANTVALRDMTTLETENVPMRDNQLLELFTYCLIDFETDIISYIGINGAPRISAIRSFFEQNIEPKENVHAVLAAIMTDDILQILVNKKIISKMTITVAVPEDIILGDIGLDAESFDMMRNIKTGTATYKIVGRRNKNIFSSSGKLAELIASIKLKYGDDLKGLSANAKDEDEKSQTYDLLQYNFTKSVVLGDDGTGLISSMDFKKALFQTYDSYKGELLRYSKL